MAYPRPFTSRLYCGAIALAGCALLQAGCTARYNDDPTLPRPVSISGADSFVAKIRKMSAEEGLAETRDYLVDAITELDDSKGVMESRFYHTNRDSGFVYPDSLITLPAAQRAKIGIAFIPGMKAKSTRKPSKVVLALKAAAGESEDLGFRSRLIPAVSRGRVAKNAAAMADALEELFAESGEVILLAKSKGAHDLIYYLLHSGIDLPAADRAKLKAVVFLGGTVQGSFAADWIANHNDAWATGARASLVLTGRGAQVGMLRTIAKSPWNDAPEGFPLDQFPNITFINLVVLPDGDDGRPSEADWSPILISQIEKTAGWESPNDSLVETAAELVPNFIEAPKWVIRTSGTHAFPKGYFLDGNKVAPNTKPLEDGTFNPDCGAEIMNAFLRALPKSVLEP